MTASVVQPDPIRRNEGVVNARITIELPHGTVHGEVVAGRADFRGVRYAELPAGANRFAECVPPGAAQDEPAAFPQRPGALDLILGPALVELPQREDAFQLRIQAPSNVESAPVLVFIPGGGFLSGSAHARWFDADALVRSGVVVVTVNYRIGALGHLGQAGDPAESGRGLRDLIRALAWVRAHIAAFGGSPEQLVLAGDSAGAWYARALSCAPETRGWIARTAFFSLPYEPPLDRAAYDERRAIWLAALSGEDPGRVDIETLLEAQGRVAEVFRGRGMALMPAAYDAAVSADAAEARFVARTLHVGSIALLTTAEEAAAFLLPAPEAAFDDTKVTEFIAARFEDPAGTAAHLDALRPGATPKQRMIDAMTLFQFRSYALEVADAAIRAGVPSWVARLAEPSPMPGLGAPHCFPLPFLFGDRASWFDAPMLSSMENDRFDRVSALLREWLIGFVRDGAPSFGGRTQPVFDPKQPAGLEIRAQGAELIATAEYGIRVKRRGGE